MVTEDVTTFRQRARTWLVANMPRRADEAEAYASTPEAELAQVARARQLQRLLFDGGFAGISVAERYGGRGLTAAHEQAFNEEATGYAVPLLFRVPTLGIILPTLLAHATEEQKERHVPNILSGAEMWVQLLSEPSGGSDLAGLLTRATSDGDTFVVHGQKVWSTGAHYVDYGLCLARTDPEVPKHRGLTMFIVPLRSPGVTAVPIRQINGEADFCEVFFDDVLVPVSNMVGDLNDGWSVASTLLSHERTAAGQTRRGDVSFDLIELAEQHGVAHDAHIRKLLADAYVLAALEAPLLQRVTASVRTGRLPSSAGALVKLYRANKAQQAGELGLEIAGTSGVAWPSEPDPGAGADGGSRWAMDYINSRARSIAGGTSEMQRNVIGERLLGLPREPSTDRDLPFSQVRHNRVERVSRREQG
jgi:alkylation response protein AidB-like acyl-CoA dehydrogenase